LAGYVSRLRSIPWQRWKKYRYPALILALGLLLLLIPAGKQEKETPEPAAPQAASDFDLETFTRQAEALLSGIQGAGKVRLLLTLEDDGRRSYLLEENGSDERDRQQREARAVLERVDGDDLPVPVTLVYPRFRGAVAVCGGADSPGTVLRIKETIGSLTGLGMDRITVIKSA